MCELCEKYGDGKIWYLNPANYATNMYRQIKEKAEHVMVRKGREAIPRNELEAVNYIRETVRLREQGSEKWIEARDKASETMFRWAPAQVVTTEEAKQIMDICGVVAVQQCACRWWSRGREENGLEESSCMGLGEGMFKWRRWPDMARGGVHFLESEDAKQWIDKMTNRGYVHVMMCLGTAPYIGGLCSCDSASCWLFKWWFGYGIKRMIKGHYVSRFDLNKCNGCGSCVSRCQYGAIKWDVDRNKPWQRESNCWGCGLCESECPVDAITLIERRTIPPLKEVWL